MLKGNLHLILPIFNNIKYTNTIFFSLKEEFNLEPSSPSEFEMFSINDFLQLKSGELIERSKELMSIGIEHITNCEVKYSFLIFFLNAFKFYLKLITIIINLL